MGLLLATVIALPITAGVTPSGNGDVNGSGGIDISDAIYILSWLFVGTDPPVPIVCPPRGGGPLPATGQTKCYDDAGKEIPCDGVDFPSQDGLYQASCPSEFRFIDDGDGTVTDHCTGLVWQKDTADTNGDGSIGEDDQLNWQDALRYCDQLEFAGCSDWRLPNVRELLSIVDHGRFDPAIDPIFGAVYGSQFGRYSGNYWTSTTHLRTPDDAWVISFGDGNITDTQKTVAPVENNTQFVRAVRGGL